jgi:putative SOS response-associated peptidase YedK
MAEQFNDVAECRPASGVQGYKFETTPAKLDRLLVMLAVDLMTLAMGQTSPVAPAPDPTNARAASQARREAFRLLQSSARCCLPAHIYI